MRGNDGEDIKASVFGAEKQSDIVFKSSDIKEKDNSDFFTRIEGDAVRKKAEKREQAIHDKNVERTRKKFQAELHKKEQKIVRENKKNERREWRIRNRRKIIVACVGVLVVGASIGGGILINNIINPPLTPEQQEFVAYDEKNQHIAENIMNDVFLKYDATSGDPDHLPSIYRAADEYISKLADEDKFSAYSHYAVFANGRSDLPKMKEVLDEMDKLKQSDLDNSKYYDMLSLYYRKIGDTEKANLYSEEASKYRVEEFEW